MIETQTDIGCDDFERAKRNREMVANKEKVAGYILVENHFAKTPLHEPIPDWIMLGSLPQVGRKDWEQSGGGQGGEFEVLETIVVVDRPHRRNGVVKRGGKYE